MGNWERYREKDCQLSGERGRGHWEGHWRGMEFLGVVAALDVDLFVVSPQRLAVAGLMRVQSRASLRPAEGGLRPGGDFSYSHAKREEGKPEGLV